MGQGVKEVEVNYREICLLEGEPKWIVSVP